MEIITFDTKEKLSVSPDIFNYPFNEGLVHQAVVAFLNNARSGNSAQKTRSEVRGGGRKPWKQKGTGRARAGTIRSPIWRGGGVTFASKKRDYSQKLNKKMYKRAIRSILSELYRRGDLLVVESFQTEDHKTKSFINKMKTFDIPDALIVMHEVTEEVYLSSRNLYEFGIADTHTVDPVVLLTFKKVIMTRDALQHLEEHLQ
ncbi:MAG: 50S ribosomal protein L4 [Gammaproteobacteria bacterium]|nr:50S ribosomal protein L4 [Gammaproteobacteria bacterium]